MNLYSLALFLHVIGSAQEVPDGPLPNVLILRTHDPILMTSASTLATLLLGIVFLMTTKPELVTSILVMAVALFLGLFVSLPFWTARRRRVGQPGAHLPGAEADPFLKQTIWTRRW